MTTSKDLLDLTAAALLGPQAGATPPAYATAAGKRVYKPGDWPTWDNLYPALKLRVLSEDKQSRGKGGRSFVTTTTIRILGQVSAPADTADGGAGVAEEGLWALQRQVEVAVINSLPLSRMLQDWPTVRAGLAFSSEGETHLAGIQIDIAMEYQQTEADFAVNPQIPLAAVTAAMPTRPGTGFSLSFDQ